MIVKTETFGGLTWPIKTSQAELLIFAKVKI